MVTELNKENFEKETKDKLCIVDFWAPWCGPCKMMAPVFKEIAEEYKGKLEFFKINTEDSQELSQKMGIMGIPCLVVFNMGEEVDRITGFNQKDQLKDKIDEILKKV